MERAVPIVEMQFTNLAGELKSIDVAYDRFKDSLKLGKGVDGSSVYMAPLEKSDLILKPIPETYFQVPWDRQRIARVLCDVFKPAKQVSRFGREEEYELSPRKYVETKMRECEEYDKANPSWDPATITRWETERYLERF